MTDESLNILRERIRELDLHLLALAAQRVELARQVGEIKRRQNLSTVDYAQEREVLDRARVDARKRGLDPDVAEDLFARLIRASVTIQEEDDLRFAATGAGKRLQRWEVWP
ncbi:hypothetical protein BH20GEM1_BH20GEM1_05750 [soil metagenome]